MTIIRCRNYLIYAPNYIRTNERYQLAISTFNVTGFFELKVAIEGFNEQDGEVKVDKLFKMSMRDETRIVELDVSDHVGSNAATTK